MCLTRVQWTCPHGLSFDSFTQQDGDLGPQTMLTAYRPEGYYRFLPCCEVCVAGAVTLMRDKQHAADADTDRCSA